MLRFILILALLFILSHNNCISQETKNDIYYISSSEGNDYNCGTKKKPLRSIASLTRNKKKNVIVRLKCGDVFYENIRGFTDCVIESYGNGTKPVICGFRILKNTDAWMSDGDRLWKLDMSKDSNFVGFPIELATDKKRFTDVGCMYNTLNDSIFGHIVYSKKQLKVDGDIYLSKKYKNEEINEETFKYFTLKYSRHPSNLRNVCFSVYENGVSEMENCIIRNIAVVGFGRHGMCRLNGCTVQNCDIDIIGGSIQTNTPKWVRYGNGIEFWITKTPIGNSTVSGCVISRTYDCGSTIQGSRKDVGSPCRIHFTGNKFFRCRQAFEHFLNSSNTEPEYIDCEFTGNVAYMMGDNGFNSTERRDADILSYENKVRNLKITGNEFFGGNYYCGHQLPEGMANNKVYIFKGQYLVHYHGSKDFPTIYAEDDNSVKEYHEKWGDNSEIIILDRGSKYEIKIRRDFENKIGYKLYDLKIQQLLKESEDTDSK